MFKKKLTKIFQKEDILLLLTILLLLIITVVLFSIGFFKLAYNPLTTSGNYLLLSVSLFAVLLIYVLFMWNKKLQKEIKERKQAQAAMQHSEKLFRGVFRNAAAGIVLLDKEGFYRHVNFTFSAMVGYSEEELRTMTFNDITYPEDLETSIKQCKEVWEGKYTRRTFEKRYICKNGDIFWAEINLSPICDSSNKITDVIVVVIDITMRKKLEEELTKRATTDFLTGLDNRLAFMQKAEEEFKRAARYKSNFALLMIDVDKFKEVNDTYGHIVGDRVLKNVAQVCKKALRESDIIGRIGGEEFAVLLLESNLNTALVAAQRIREKVQDLVIESDEEKIQVTISIGIGIMENGDRSFDEVFKRADDALYEAKRTGRNRICM